MCSSDLEASHQLFYIPPFQPLCIKLRGPAYHIITFSQRKGQSDTRQPAVIVKLRYCIGVYGIAVYGIAARPFFQGKAPVFNDDVCYH